MCKYALLMEQRLCEPVETISGYYDLCPARPRCESNSEGTGHALDRAFDTSTLL